MALAASLAAACDVGEVGSGTRDGAARDAATRDAPGGGGDVVMGVDSGNPPPLDATSPMDAPVVPMDGPPGCPALPPPAARPPAAGPNREAVVQAVASERPDLLANSCPAMGGNNQFLFEVVRRLRAMDPRWGLDRHTGSLAGDLVTYFHGEGCPEGSRDVYVFDVIARLCARPGVDAPPAPSWLDRADVSGVWTLMGFDGTPLPDAGMPPGPDASTTRPPLPDGSSVVNAVARERPDLLANSCVEMGGNNEFLFEVVRRLRRMDPRWGLNWKRGRVGDMSQDVVDYYRGPAGTPMEGSTDVYIVDMIGGHCGPSPSPAWIDVTEATKSGGTVGRWTLAGRSDL